MNLKVLRAAERSFLEAYPGGFEHPEMMAVGKKHKMDQFSAFAKERFAKARFEDPAAIVEDMAKLVGKSTMVSMFEKPKFRDAARKMRGKQTQALTEALYELLHGKQKAGFEALVDHLAEHKLAKWPLATVFQSYYRPQKEVFVKPTTAKLIVDRIGLDLTYRSLPTWEFYRDFRKAVLEMRGKVHKSVAPNNPAFCGFLMMTLRDLDSA